MGAPRAPEAAARRVHAGVVAVAVVMVLSACTSGAGSGADGGAFTQADLGGIVLTSVDAPDGTTYSRTLSGLQDLDTFASSEAELALLRQDRFVIGHLALFPPTGHSEPGQGGLIQNANAPFLQGIAGLFEAPEGAASALHRFVDGLKDVQMVRAEDVVAPSLGDEAFGIEGDAPNGTHLLVYAWRDANLVLAVSGAGKVSTPDVVRGLAELVEHRAEA
jgi:hypothetical protein